MKALKIVGIALGVLVLVSLLGGCVYSVKLNAYRDCLAFGQILNSPSTWHWWWGCQIQLGGRWWYFPTDFIHLKPGPGPL
jgi:hypothetical protein